MAEREEAQPGGKVLPIHPGGGSCVSNSRTAVSLVGVGEMVAGQDFKEGQAIVMVGALLGVGRGAGIHKP
jgi:hypothetical protein